MPDPVFASYSRPTAFSGVTLHSFLNYNNCLFVFLSLNIEKFPHYDNTLKTEYRSETGDAADSVHSCAPTAELPHSGEKPVL